jgi:hypothetical protein
MSQIFVRESGCAASFAEWPVAKLKAARDRKREREGKCEGRKSYAERDPESRRQG